MDTRTTWSVGMARTPAPTGRGRLRALLAVGLTSALALTGVNAGAEAAPASAADVVLFEQNFDGSSGIPSGITVHDGSWSVSGDRLVGTASGSTRARVTFGPAAPTNFLFETTVQFESVENAARWLNLGIDYHAAADYGSVAVLRSGTTASNGVELAQKSTASGSWASNPVGPAHDDLAVGEDHQLQVEVRGTAFTIRMDGVPVLTGSNLTRTGGGFGLVVNRSTVQFDDIVITELPADNVIYQEDFTGVSGIPSDILTHAGSWTVAGDRLVGTATGSTRSRVSFGPAAPENFRFEATVQFVSVANAARWINFGVDYHAAADYGSVVVLRSGTTASNGVELAQKATASGSWASSPVAAAPDDLSVGEDHHVAVEVHGTQYVVRIDGVPVMSGTNLARTGGSFGFVVNQSVVQFDDIKITELSSSSAPEFLVDGVFPTLIDAGNWPTSHIQGIAYDPVNEVMYHSFTTMLIKTDLHGNVLGTLEGWTGHLGDLDFGDDGLIYGSLEYKAQNTFYIAVIEGDKITRPGQKLSDDPTVFHTVFLPEATADYVWDATGNGFAGNTGNTDDHRFGASGIDGVSFGPAFGETSGPRLLTVAYGIYTNLTRTDNDYQVLLQYDTSEWSDYWTPLNEGAPHTNGPASTASDGYGGKFFVYTGNTNYGVQNLEYDEHLERWWMAVYNGSKPAFPNYGLFAVEASTQPVVQSLVGQPVPTTGSVLALPDDGLEHAESGVRGWNFTGSTGFQGVGNGLYYVVTSWGAGGRQYATLRLTYWTGSETAPFANALPGFRVAPTALTGPAVTEIALGESFDGGFTATGNGAPAYRVTAGSLPDGVRLVAATGQLVGESASAGTFTITVEAVNGADVVASDEFVLTVVAPEPPAPGSNSAVCTGDRGQGAEHANPRAKQKCDGSPRGNSGP